MDTSLATSDAAAYARISDNDRPSQDGVTSQHQKNRRRAKSDGLTIKHELTDDDRSAYKEGVIRDQYERLLRLIKDGKIRYVLVRHLDRLHRQNGQAEQFLKLAQRHNIVVITSSGQRYLFDSAESKKAFRNAAVDAQYESEIKSERQQESREYRAQLGRYGGGSRRPFGWGAETHEPQYAAKLNGKQELRPAYRIDEDGRSIWIDFTKHNPEEAKEIRRWKRELFSGVSQAELLRSIKFPTVTGNKRWDARTVQQVLTNPRTSGHSVHNGEVIKHGAWDPILTDDERDALKAFFADPTRKTSPGNVPKWLGSMIFRCGQCDDGTPMTVRYANGDQRVYRCQIKGHCQRDANTVEGFVEELIIGRLSRKDVIKLVIPDEPDIDTSAIRDRIQILRLKQDEWALAEYNEEMTRKQCSDNTMRANREIKELNEKLASARRTESPIAEFVTCADQVEVRARWNDLDIQMKRVILRNLLEVTLDPIGRGRRKKDASPMIRWGWVSPTE